MSCYTICVFSYCFFSSSIFIIFPILSGDNFFTKSSLNAFSSLFYISVISIFSSTTPTVFLNCSNSSTSNSDTERIFSFSEIRCSKRFLKLLAFKLSSNFSICQICWSKWFYLSSSLLYSNFLCSISIIYLFYDSNFCLRNFNSMSRLLIGGDISYGSKLFYFIY